MSRLLPLVLIGLAISIAACSTVPMPTRVPSPSLSPSPSAATLPGETDLSSLQVYLLGKLAELKTSTSALAGASNRYYELATEAQFNYAALWQSKPNETRAALTDARGAWVAASPLYEQIEGIVAGVPTLREYDIILDAGASAKESPDDAVPFDLRLPDGRVLARPGNLFGVTESTLWGTEPEFSSGVRADIDGNGIQDFSDLLPDANVLKSAAETMDSYVGQLSADAQKWQPSESDAFTALVTMVPTMSEYFESWKNSRFVAGDSSSQRDFVVISRLSDIQDILSSLQVVYGGISPRVKTLDASQDDQVSRGLYDLKAFVANVYHQEKQGKKFTPEDADILGAEAETRASAITGQISQIAGRLGVEIVE